MAEVNPPVRPPQARIDRLNAVADLHSQWVDAHLDDAPFRPEGRPAGSDYNQHYVDLESDDSEFHANAMRILTQ